MPLIQHQVVDTYHWLDGKGFADLVTISQMTPGPIATNAATFVGMNTAGLAGALIATFGCILPSCILVTFIAYFYLKYQKLAALQGILSSLRPAVIALIASAGISILVSAFWNGQTVIRDAAELKVKESDRIATVTAGLRAMGCDITPTDDGMIIRGGKTLHGAEIDSYLDHRIAMSFAVAALAADGVTSIKDADCVKISYPNFYDDLLGLAK